VISWFSPIAVIICVYVMMIVLKRSGECFWASFTVVRTHSQAGLFAADLGNVDHSTAIQCGTSVRNLLCVCKQSAIRQGLTIDRENGSQLRLRRYGQHPNRRFRTRFQRKCYPVRLCGFSDAAVLRAFRLPNSSIYSHARAKALRAVSSSDETPEVSINGPRPFHAHFHWFRYTPERKHEPCAIWTFKEGLGRSTFMNVA
jgi:hypothetical protein